MSQEQAHALMERLQSDPDLTAKINATTSYSEFQSVAANAGFDLSDLSEEDAKAIAAGGVGGGEGELSDADLEQVAGGGINIQMNNW